MDGQNQKRFLYQNSESLVLTTYYLILADMFWFDFNWEIQHFLNQWWWQINFLLLVILVVLGYLSYRRPIQAIALTITLLPTYLFRSQVWFLPFTFLELCILITFCGWIIKLIFQRYQLPVTSYQLYRWPIILILFGATVALMIAPDLRAAAGLWKAYFIEPIMLFVVAANVIQTKKDKAAVLWALGISTLLISLLAIYQKLTGFGIFEPSWVAVEHRRVTSIFSSPNAVGLFLGPIVTIYFGWLMSEFKKFWATLLKLLIILPALLAIYFTVSQGTWLGLAAAIVFLLFFGWNKKWTAAMIALIIILTMLLPLTRQLIWPIINFSDASGQNRLTLIQMSFQYLSTNPKNFVLGAGILGFVEIQNRLREPLKMEALLYPHNFILNFWLEIGLVGLVGFSWLIIKFFRHGYQKFKSRGNWLTLGILAGMVAILVHGLIDVPYFKNDLAVLFWILIALL